MDAGFFIFIISAISGVTYIFLGFLLSYKQKIDIINGVDFSKLKDIKGFCKYFGNSLSLSGAMLILLGLMVYAQNMNLILFLVLFIVFCALPILYFFQAKQKFSQSAT